MRRPSLYGVPALRERVLVKVKAESASRWRETGWFLAAIEHVYRYTVESTQVRQAVVDVCRDNIHDLRESASFIFVLDCTAKFCTERGRP